MPNKLNLTNSAIFFFCFLLRFFYIFIEPVEVIQTTSEIPWHYIIPSSVFAVIALIVALGINFLRLRKGAKLVVSIH